MVGWFIILCLPSLPHCILTIEYRPPNHLTIQPPTMLIVDAHLDLAWNALDWNRDLLRPVSEIRARECELKMTGKGRGENTVAFPELRRGGVGLFIATLFARPLRANLMPTTPRSLRGLSASITSSTWQRHRTGTAMSRQPRACVNSRRSGRTSMP